MKAKLIDFYAWCRRHLLLTTVASVLLIGAFTFIQVEILHMTSEPEFCAMCHPKHGVGPLAEVDSWEHSGHADAGVSCLDCHGRPGPVGYMKAKLGGLKDTYMQFTISPDEKLEILANPSPDLVPEEQCLFCHSDEGNAEFRANHTGPMEIVHMRLLDSVVNPDFRTRKGLPDILTDTSVGGIHFDHNFHIEDMELTCRDCHFGVVHNPGNKTDRMNTCAECHEGEDDAPQLADCTTCHEAQLAMNEGRGAEGVVGEAGYMFQAKVNCTDCHSSVEEGTYRSSASTCTDCHDEDYSELFGEWSLDTKKAISSASLLRAEVETALSDADHRDRDTSALWVTYQRAMRNLNFVRDDGTNGVHNIDYATDILAQVTSDLNQVKKSLQDKW